MATWKKVIVSGSNAELNQVNVGSVQQLTTDTGTTRISGSFSGSFQGAIQTVLPNINRATIVAYDVATGTFSYQGTGSFTATTASYVASSGVDGPLGMNSILSASNALTSSLAQKTTGALTQGAGITSFTFDGSASTTVAVSGAATLTTDKITKWTGTAFADSGLTDNGTTISGNTSIQLTGANTQLTGSFTGSFKGDGSGLSGLATVLTITGSDGTSGSVNLVSQGLTITGTVNEVETSVSNQTVTIGLPNNVVIGNNLIVNNNLTVLGTASFQNTVSLEVADRFILLASGSNTTGDGGLVVQQATQNVGELFGFDSGTTRWGVTSSFNASNPSYTPDAFMAAVVEGTVASPTGVPGRYVAKGNMFIGNDESIWIYS